MQKINKMQQLKKIIFQKFTQRIMHNKEENYQSNNNYEKQIKRDFMTNLEFTKKKIRLDKRIIFHQIKI